MDPFSRGGVIDIEEGQNMYSVSLRCSCCVKGCMVAACFYKHCCQKRRSREEGMWDLKPRVCVCVCDRRLM